jgi:hypothetical protein
MNSELKRFPRIHKTLAVVGWAFMACWQGSALGHHSFAAYDQGVTKSVAGTLKEFDWNAPHSGITVTYTDEKGQVQEVSVTTGAPSTIAAQGFKPKDFRVGTKVALSWHPNRNGLPGGEMTEIRLEDGRVLKGGFGGRPPPGAPGAPPPGTAPPGAPPTQGNAPPSSPRPGSVPPSGSVPPK